MTHVKLLSFLGGILLFLFSISGGFGILIAKILGYIMVGAIVLGVYFFIHEITFGEHSGGNGFD